MKQNEMSDIHYIKISEQNVYIENIKQIKRLVKLTNNLIQRIENGQL